jgi:acyl carrier protein
MKPMNTVVRQALARRAHLDEAAIRSSQNLQRDLHLSNLDLVLLAIDVEDIQDVMVPIDDLRSVETVADLLLFFARVGASERRLRHGRLAEHFTGRSFSKA